ncbi:MAG: hypothetical protein A2Z28_07305 [Chloroflexi bacterium RBG_16_51_9]|nr:MAG: hypothetical protein A2Z28_07305 [Chloroflexi bacterium RBG_16_51_9]
MSRVKQETPLVTETSSLKVEQIPSSIDRREFLIRAAALAFSASSLAAFLEACTAVKPGTPSPAPTLPPPSEPSIPTPPASSAPPLESPTLPPVTAPVPPPPSAVLDTEGGKISHLLRRAGFGANEQELSQFTAMGVSATVDYLVDFEKTDDSALETRLSGINLNLDNLVDLQRWWFLRMIYTRRPLQEKMVLFWHGLLTSGYSKVGRGPYMYTQNQTLRKLCVGRYGDLLKAIARDPAMLIWLDSQVNKKAAPNENFARELMELFSMGIGNYTEGDVRESARAFTGWLLSQGVFYFNFGQHDNGLKFFLGRTGNFDGDDIIKIITEQPVTAEFICRKLFSFFAYDDPSPEVVSRLAGTLRDAKYSIKEVMRQILTSPEFYSPKAYRAKIKSPAELVAATVRTLNIETDAAGLPGFADRMSQSLFNPFDVQGWPGGAVWINSNTLLQRLNFANTVSIARSANFQFNPQETARRLNISSADRFIDYFTSLLLDGNMSDEELGILKAFGSALDVPGGFSNAPSDVVDEKLRSLVYLIMASPDYQLA